MDTTLILFLTVSLLLWILALTGAIHLGRLARMLRREQQAPLRHDGLPAATVIITTHNQEPELRRHLPLILQQQYPAEYEVIVVDMNSTDDTLALLEGLEEEYPHLHHTHCPCTARDISLLRLALTLGIRSAGYEWLVLTQADCQVPSSQWLLHLMQPCTDKADAVLGLTRYAHPDGLQQHHRQFLRFWQQTLWMPWSRRFAPIQADGTVLCYRKSLFMQHQGFASSFSLMSGAATLLVNHNVSRGRCRLNLLPQAQVVQQMPVGRIWRQERIFQVETGRHLHHAFFWRLWYSLNIWPALLYPLAAAIGVALLRPALYVSIPLAILWVVLLVTQMQQFHASTQTLQVPGYAGTLPFRLLLLPLHQLSTWFSWLLTRKKTFRKKFV